jgi:hypothetical protein
VLPQQLKVALLGLGRLGRLSVPNYERIGGVPGLEARYVADSLARAAARADLDAAAVRTALVRLVEPDGARRAPPLPASDLALGLPERDAARLGGALEALEEADILRRRQVGGIDAWQLDHDYLARGILRIEADADRWRVMLARRAAEFADARGSLLARWRALLSTREQVAFLLARLRRRFRYGEHRWFAALSAAPYAAGLLVVGTALGIGYVAVGELAARTAWQAMPGGIAMSPGNRALTNVAEWPSFARRAFVRQLFEDPERAEHAAAWPEPVVRAVVGLDEDRAAEFARRVAAAAAVGKDNDAAVDAAAAMLPLLPASALRTVPEPLAAALAEARARGASLDSAALRALAADRRREVDASRALEPILEELTRGEPVDRVSLAEHQRFLAAMQLVRVGPRLGPEALAAAAERLHAALLAPDRRPSAAGPLLLGYALLARRLPPAGQERAAAALVGWTGAEDDEFRLAAANALQLLAVRMPTGVSSATARALLDGLRTAQGKVLRTRDGYFNLVVLLATSYAAAVPPSAERERAAAAAVVLDEMRAHRGDLWPVAFLADAHALLTLGAGASGGVQRADARATLLEALSTFSTSKRRAAVDAAEQPHTLLREVFLLCGSDGCARLFAAAVVDAAAGRPSDERAALLLELLKLPALAGMTNALLAQLRREDGAAAAGVPEGGLWQIVAWAKARGLDPGKPLDGERLLGALAP